MWPLHPLKSHSRGILEDIPAPPTHTKKTREETVMEERCQDFGSQEADVTKEMVLNLVHLSPWDIWQ